MGLTLTVTYLRVEGLRVDVFNLDELDDSGLLKLNGFYFMTAAIVAPYQSP